MGTPVRGPVVIRRRLGAALKQLRVEKGYHLDVVAKALEVSPAKLSRLETGQVAPKIRDVRDLLDLYQARDDLREQFMQWTDDAKGQGWWQPFHAEVPADLDLYISLEAEARMLQLYCTPIPGLLQTEAYARMLLSGAAPRCTPDQLEELVKIRIRRQAVLEQARDLVPPLDLHVVLDEAALYRRAPACELVLVDQLRELLGRPTKGNIKLQVFPFSQGYDEAFSTFAIFEPREKDDWTVVNVESTDQDAYYDSPSEVRRYQKIWDDLTARALTPEQSRDLIRSVIATWEGPTTECSPTTECKGATPEGQNA